jgi:phosphoglycolate phosphatase
MIEDAMTSQSHAARVQHVVFDWNGTLIDDCALAIASVNALRDDLGMPRITRDEYRRAFRFPIREFYRSIGFDVDGEAFPALMQRYLALFDARVDDCPLHAGARDALDRLRTAGVRLHILSASHHATLATNLRVKGLAELFDEIAGLGHTHATTKHELGRDLAARLAAPPDCVIYVGDTDHDYEVARAQGWRFLFVDHGHQAAVDAPHCAHRLAALDEIFGHLRDHSPGESR